MSRQASLQDAVDTFTAACDGAEAMAPALDSLASALGAQGATLVFGSTAPNSVIATPEVVPLLADYFAFADPREARVQPGLDDGFRGDPDDFTPDEIAAHPFYQEFLRPRGFGWHAAATLAAGPDDVVLSLKRLHRHGPFTRTELGRMNATLRALRPAVRRARITRRMAAMSELDGLDRVGAPALLLGRDGAIIAANAAARALDLPVAAGALRPAGAARAQLETALAAAIRPGASPLPPVLLPRADGRPLVLDVLPPPPLCRAWVREVHALAVVTDLDAQTAPAAARLCHVFRLTPREADLALLIGGANGLDDAAEQLKISREHARQRLKLIFAKTGVHRQAELVALVGRLAEPRGR